MDQSKTKFIVDNYITIKSGNLTKVAYLLFSAGVLFVCEPWPDGHYRIYVRKDVKHLLEVIEADVNEKTDNARVPKPH